jgi:hypothetical protein
MKKIAWILCAFLGSIWLGSAHADTQGDPLMINLSANPNNPPAPRMGDHLKFQSSIRNDGAAPISGLIVWLSLLQTDKGLEQPVDLEDWSAQKAIAVPMLSPGQSIQSEWDMRLIQSGNYSVVVSAVSQVGNRPTVSTVIDFNAKEKPVVESNRVLPIAFGLPALFGLLLFLRLRRR